MNIITIGGGRIYANETKTIDDYIFSILSRENRSISILPTASKDRPDYIEAVRKIYETLAVKTNVIYEKDLIDGNFSKVLSNSSGLYIGGGDAIYLSYALKKTNCLLLIKEYANTGKVVAGLSAGAALLFERAIFCEDNKCFSIEGLGILEGVVIPHFNQCVLDQCKDLIIEFGSDKRVYGISNGAAMHFVSQNNYRVITEPYSAGVWKISVNSGNVSQEKL